MAFVKLANAMPIDKISVTKITEECGVNRNTFYYHYRDVYDLVDDVVHTKSEKLFDPEKHKTLADALILSAQYAKKNSRFIKNIYCAVGADKFEEYLTEITRGIMYSYVTAEADKALTQKGKTISEDDLGAVCELSNTAFRTVALKWIKSDMKTDPVQIVENYLVMTRGCLEVILNNLGKEV